jgi:UDP-N-acetylmuramate dehydrogenase
MHNPQAFKKAIKERVKGKVSFDEPMAAHTWFRVGGPADAYVAPESADELIDLVQWLVAENIFYAVIGGGSNLLVKDRGVRGVVIDTSAGVKGISVATEGAAATVLRAMAGEPLNRLCRFAIDKALAGLNFAIGIPGTVGGAIMMNAGTADGSIQDALLQATILFPDGRVEALSGASLDFKYRGLELPESDDAMHPPVILGGSFQLYPSGRDELAAEAENLLKQRQQRQPKGGASAGCFFKNPETGEPAGALIEKAGMKGACQGDAQVSEVHANFILNRGRATAADILQLMEKIQTAVHEQFGIWLKPEVRIVGN